MGVTLQAFADRIRTELMKRPDRHPNFRSQKQVLIRCPDPNHKDGQESNPSLMVRTDPERRDVGRYICRTCGIKGDWSELARRLNLDPLTGVELEWSFHKPITDDQLKRMLGQTPSEVTKGLPWPKDEPWRGIAPEFLTKLGAVLDTQFGPRVRLPVTVRGRVRGYVNAVIDPDKTPPGSPRYLNSSGAWVMTYGLFGFDMAMDILRRMKHRVLLLGEGPRDAANPLQYDYPAIGVLGSETQWTKSKADLITTMDLDLLVIATDPDKSGDAVADMIRPALDGRVTNIRYRLRSNPDGSKAEDLGELSPERLAYVWARCMEKVRVPARR